MTNVVGGPQPGVHSEIHKVRLQHNDLFLLCSDGLTEAISDARIAEILGHPAGSHALARQLIDAALDGGAPDNVTVIVARFDEADDLKPE